MKTKIEWIAMVLLLSSPLWGQDTDEKLRTLRTQNLEIEDLFRQIEQLEASVAQASDSLRQIKDSWKEICERYMLSDRQTDEDFLYLISHTYSEFDGEELKNRLKQARQTYLQKRDDDKSLDEKEENNSAAAEEPVEVVAPQDPDEEDEMVTDPVQDPEKVPKRDEDKWRKDSLIKKKDPGNIGSKENSKIGKNQRKE